jgi:DNA-binding MarR family transcriptional regulator
VDRVVKLLTDDYQTNFRAIEQMLKESVQEFGEGWGSISLLTQISKGQRLTMSDLAERNHITKGAISTQVTGMLTKGLVEVVADCNDRRRYYIHLTSKGERLMKRVNDHTQFVAHDVIKTMGMVGVKLLHNDFTTFTSTIINSTHYYSNDESE